MSRVFLGICILILAAVIHTACSRSRMSAAEALAIKNIVGEVSQTMATGAEPFDREKSAAQDAFADCVARLVPRNNPRVRLVIDGMHHDPSIAVSKNMLKIIEAEFGVSTQAAQEQCR